MSELLDEIIVELDRPVLYTPKGEGEQVESKTVVLKAPSAKQLQYTSVLKQAFFQALSSLKDESGNVVVEGDESEMNGEAIISMLYMSNVDFNKIQVASRELFKLVGSLDGQKDLNDLLINKLGADDFEKMIGEYLVNFTLASALKQIK